MKLEGPIATGNTAKVFLHKGMAVKVFNDNLPAGEALYEANKQKIAYSKGLPVPKVIDVTKVDGKQAMIMEHIRGRTIGEIIFENERETEEYLNLSIDIQQLIHKHTADSLEPMSRRSKNKIEQAALLDEKDKSNLINKLKSISYEERLCHGDFHVFNLIISDEGKVTIIDWVDATAGDIRADICRTYHLYSQYSIDLAEMYLRGFLRKGNLSKEEVLQWEPILAGARLAENVSEAEAVRLKNIINKCRSS